MKNLKLKKLIFYLILFSLILPSTLLLSEVILRISGQTHYKVIHSALNPVFDNIPGVYEPGQNFIDQSKPELPHHVFINSLGYRGPEIERKKYPDRVRILCLGASFTFGNYVSDDETIPYKLQNLYEQKQGLVEVVNGGMAGTTIVDQFYLLKKGIELDPDIVILIFCLNDIPDLNSTQPFYVRNMKKILILNHFL